jgi:hypothetical protein
LFGPIGLFYASVTGGLLMIVSPFLLLAFAGSNFIATSFGLLIFVYWLTCIIWGAVAVDNYNHRIISYARKQQVINDTSQQKQEPVQQVFFEKQNINQVVTDINKPTLNDWRKENPHRSINDYFQRFGNPTPHSQTQTTMTTPSYETETKKANNTWVWFSIIGVVAILLFLMYDKNTNSFQINKLTGVFDSHSKDREEIKNQIERTYFGLLNGAYTSEGIQGLGADGLPFYNQNMSTLFAMGLMPFANLSGEFKLEPKNISIENITEDTAFAKYNLVMTNKEEQTNIPIAMTVKKIGGHWKLDGARFLPFDLDNSKKKRKK